MKLSLFHGPAPWALALAVAFGGTAHAQTAARPQPQEPSEVREVVVTGSAIRGTPEDAALPVDVIGQEELERQGTPSVVELVKSLPVSNGVLGDTNQFDSRAQGTEGSGSVNLRGLGAPRTLVLLNGRRLAINPLAAAGGGVVDTNMLPIAAVGRVEVLKDGAAAIYGSDAIAGVVNFITRENFDGLELSADYKYIDGSDGDYSVSALYGWQGENADVLLSVGYQHRSVLELTDRDFADREYLENPEGGWTALGNPSTLLSFGPPTTGPGPTPQIFRDPQCAALGGYPGFSGATPACIGHFVEWDNLIEKEEHYQAYGEVNVELAPNHTFHVEGLYGKTEVPEFETSPSYALLASPTSEVFANAEPVGPGGVIPASTLYAGRYYIPRNAPGLVDFVSKNTQYADLLEYGAALVNPLARPMLLGGNPLFGTDRGSSLGKRFYEAYRVSGGFTGDLPFGGLGYDVALTYSQETGSRVSVDSFANRFALALQGFGGPNCDKEPNTPGIQGSAGQNGCLYFNPLSNSIQMNPITGQTNPQYNPALANDVDVIRWFFQPQRTSHAERLFVLDAVINGPVGFELPGGDVQFAAGVQFRRDIYEIDVNAAGNAQVNPCINTPDYFVTNCTGAARNGPNVFLGTFTPQKVDQDVYAVFGELQIPVTDDINVQIAARYEDYGGEVGSTFDPKISARWQIIDQIALRGSVGSTFRGPPTAYLNDNSVTSLQQIAGGFRAVDVVGNPNLQPESAITYGFGVILDVGNFRGSLDYYKFKFEDSIVAEPVSTFVNAVFPSNLGPTGRCGEAAVAALQSRFTFGGDGTCSSTNISRLRTFFVNSAPVNTSGLDFIGEYDLPDVLGGEVTVGGTGTYILEYVIDPLTIGGIQSGESFDAVGLLNYQTTAVPLPEWKGQLFLDYDRDIHSVRLSLNYIDGYTDQRTSPFASNVYRDSSGNFVTISAGKEIDAFVTVDATYRVELPWDTTAIISIDNVLDEDPPFARLDLSYDPFTANPYGRTIKVGVKKTF